jgi:hypothetical protein
MKVIPEADDQRLVECIHDSVQVLPDVKAVREAADEKAALREALARLFQTLVRRPNIDRALGGAPPALSLDERLDGAALRSGYVGDDAARGIRRVD